MRTNPRASKGKVRPLGAGATAGQALIPPFASRPCSFHRSLGVGSRLRCPALGASGQDRLRRVARDRWLQTSRVARRAPPFPKPQTARRPDCKGSPARLRTHTGRYSHGDAFAPGRAAGKLSDPHRQWQSAAGSAQT